MGLRNTEKRIPEGFNPKDLGQSVRSTTDNYDLALISYLTEPIPVGSTIDYVAFVLRYPPGVDEALSYAWNFRMDNDDGTKDDSGTLQTIFGINSYIPKKTGKLTVTVSIGRDSTTEVALTMQQKIVRNNASEYLNSIYRNLLNPSINTDISDSSTCENINPSAFTEVINELEQYIHLSAISPSSHSIPARFLAAIAYKGASDFPKEINSQNIWKVSRQRDISRAQDLLNRPSAVNITDKNLKLGVCQVKPESLKAVLDAHLWDQTLSEDDKQIDLFNLLRFPKTNILMCAWILNSYREDRDWVNAKDCLTVVSKGKFNGENALLKVANNYNSKSNEYTAVPTNWDDYELSIIKLMKTPFLAMFFSDAYGGYNLMQGDNVNSSTYGGVPRPASTYDPTTTARGGFVSSLQSDLYNLGFGIVNDNGSHDSGIFSLHVEWAVREFQIYAKMQRVAKEINRQGSYVEKLEPVDNSFRYVGPISGVMNAMTRATMQYWMDNNWRCPVVIGAYSMRNGQLDGSIYSGHENIWHHDEVQDKTPRMFARDFTGYYMNKFLFNWDGFQENESQIRNIVNFLEQNFDIRDIDHKYVDKVDNGMTIRVPYGLLPDQKFLLKLNQAETKVTLFIEESDTTPVGELIAKARNIYQYTFSPDRRPDDLIAVGYYETFPVTNYSNNVTKTFCGPRSMAPHHTWPECELLPQYLTGIRLNDMTDQQRSTFKIIRAVSEVECMGFFDVVNSYDNAFLSQGPCHWTLGLVLPVNNGNWVVEEGELCGYLAYLYNVLYNVEPDACKQPFDFFGLRINKQWGISGDDLFFKDQRKYTGWISQQQDDGSYSNMDLDENQGNYFKNWHWFYRFIMAGRTNAAFRSRMWDMARIRLRDICSTPWPANSGPQNSDGSPATIGDIYTSEKAVAMILRWHVSKPVHVVANRGVVGNHLQQAYNIARNAANAAGNANPTQGNLIQGIVNEIQSINNQNLIQTTAEVKNFPIWVNYNHNPPIRSNGCYYQLDINIGTLSEAEDSFQPYYENLPEPPNY